MIFSQTNFPKHKKGENILPKSKEWRTSPGSHIGEVLEASEQTAAYLSRMVSSLHPFILMLGVQVNESQHHLIQNHSCALNIQEES